MNLYAFAMIVPTNPTLNIDKATGIRRASKMKSESKPRMPIKVKLITKVFLQFVADLLFVTVEFAKYPALKRERKLELILKEGNKMV